MNFEVVDSVPPKGHGGGKAFGPETVELANFLNEHVGTTVKITQPMAVNYGRTIKASLAKIYPGEYRVSYRKSDEKSDTSKYHKQWIYITRVS